MQLTRQRALSILAQSHEDHLLALWTETFHGGQNLDEQLQWLRRPEIGTVMARGRMGGTGDAFNLGEITVTRCSIRLGEAVGHGYVQGRSKEKARVAALCDALLQGEAAGQVETGILLPLAKAQEQRQEKVRAKAAATKVDFFTLVRGEDG